jgi:hypothetical protein
LRIGRDQELRKLDSEAPGLVSNVLQGDPYRTIFAGELLDRDS